MLTKKLNVQECDARNDENLYYSRVHKKTLFNFIECLL